MGDPALRTAKKADSAHGQRTELWWKDCLQEKRAYLHFA